MSDEESTSALMLFSGGLDSQLAVCLLRDQGIGVVGVFFESPFVEGTRVTRAAELLDLPLRTVDFFSDSVSLLHKPKHGFGDCLNPCVDCHALMLRRAGERLEEWGARFLATGEVLDERPMSQNRNSLRIVAAESGFADLIVRPLSALLLPETRPEREGWIDRSRLLSLKGRTRKPQLELAARYGLEEIPAPAGGCRLTEPNYCRRLRDLLDHEELDGELSVRLLRLGRHFRLAEGIKLIVGRNMAENEALEAHAGPHSILMEAADAPGPIGLLSAGAGGEQVRLSAMICARYSDARPDAPATMRIRSPAGARDLEVMPLDPPAVARLMI